MERLSLITYKNCQIVFFNGQGATEEEICSWIDKLTEFAIKNKTNRILLDVTGTFLTPKVKEAATNSAKKAEAHFGKMFSSIVGLSTVQRLIANAIFRGQYFAANIEDAKNWLASKA
jgi:hypothetical protein